MSQENVETVRALYEAWNSPGGFEAAIAFISDDFEWVNPPYAVEPGTKYGHAGWRAAGDNLAAAFHVRTHELLEVRGLGGRVLCFTTFTARTAFRSEYGDGTATPHAMRRCLQQRRND